MAVHLYTRYVKILRLVLPVLAGVSLLGLLVWPFWREHRQNDKAVAALAAQNATRNDEVADAAAAATAQNGVPLQVIRPDYQGLDRQGRPYHITAERVEQTLDPRAPITLIQPSATLTMRAAEPDDPARRPARSLTLTAAHGLYDAAAQTLDLKGDVTLRDATGYTLSMQDLAIDLARFYAMTMTPVTGSGPQGSFSGQTLNIADKGAVIVLKGPSRLVFQPATVAPQALPAPRPESPPSLPASSPLPVSVVP